MDARPPYPFELKRTVHVPYGVMLTEDFIVLWCLYMNHVTALDVSGFLINNTKQSVVDIAFGYDVTWNSMA